MLNIIVPLALGFLIGNEKAQVQLAMGLQQLAGMGVDALNGMNKGGDKNVAEADTNKKSGTE